MLTYFGTTDVEDLPYFYLENSFQADIYIRHYVQAFFQSICGLVGEAFSTTQFT